MRLMSAAPRGVIANSRSSVTTFGRRLVMVSSACSASASENSRTSPLTSPARSTSAGRRSGCAMKTVKRAGTAGEYTIPREDDPLMEQPPFRDVTVGDLLSRLALALPAHEALVYAGGPRYTFESLEREARTIARGLIALGV